MSGHSKWATIKHKKGALDAKRGAIFTKIIKELTVAAKNGGGNPDANPRLRTVLQKAKEANMPSDNIDRAIKKGTGELPGMVYEELTYEGYGPGGIALLIELVTDNKNRTAAEIRNILEKKGGNMSGAGSVAWQFAKKGFLVVQKSAVDEEKLMTIALDAGASDFAVNGDNYEITTEPPDFDKVKKAVTDAGVATESAEVTFISSSTVKIADPAAAKSVLTLIEALEEHEDVQNVYSNFDIPDDVMKELAG
ncbi:MAG TPA: YebC/PmpR family DNA-binding transcriptional regulator [Candidatus Eisenbacteria bacterium]|jgi:YebC/PmpR family DNA-binding regulatory protein|nr:YebC/PmpR family DNA-binding transcriptional regulator [Candidatus Eisenbacteria bacterium]